MSLIGIESSCQQSCVPSGNFAGEESTSRLICVIDRTQFLMVLGLRSPFPSWLLPGATFSSQRPLSIPCTWSLHFRNRNSMNFCMLSISSSDSSSVSVCLLLLLSRAHVMTMSLPGQFRIVFLSED